MSQRDPVDGLRVVEMASIPLIADLSLSWRGDAPEVELALVTVNGTIAGAFPRVVRKNELYPIHRRFLPPYGAAVWYLRVTAAERGINDLAVAVQLQDGIGRSRSIPLCEHANVEEGRTLTIEASVEIPEQLA